MHAHLPESAEFIAALREYRDQLRDAYLRDLGDRAFPRRAWTWYDEPLGENDMWLEPQGFTLLIPEFPADRKRRPLRRIRAPPPHRRSHGPAPD